MKISRKRPCCSRLWLGESLELSGAVGLGFEKGRRK